MARFNIFVIRAILGAAIAVLLSRMFHPDAGIIHMIGLGVFLVAAAYGLEYWRNSKTDKQGE